MYSSTHPSKVHINQNQFFFPSSSLEGPTKKWGFFTLLIFTRPGHDPKNYVAVFCGNFEGGNYAFLGKGGPSLGHLKLDHFDIVDFHSACTMCGEARVASASCPLVTMPNTADQHPALHSSTCHYTSTPYHHDITLHNITPLHYTSTPYHCNTWH